MRELLVATTERAIRYLENLDKRSVAPDPKTVARLAELDKPLSDHPSSPDVLQVAMAVSAAYIPSSSTRDPADFTPELSRRARGIEVWAVLHSLGRFGVADLVERTCRYARRFAEGLQAAGYRVLNEVVLNQVLVTFGDAERTWRVIAGIQEEGTCWCGGTVWQGQTAMRISVSSWATTEEDVERSLEAMIRVARKAM